MIETKRQQERVILLGVELQTTEHFDMSMTELANLAKTAGVKVMASFSQNENVTTAKPLSAQGNWMRLRRLWKLMRLMQLL